MFTAIPRAARRMFPLIAVEPKSCFRIRDYGKGIPPDVLDRFRRKRAHGGVGLAGMRERIHELGGRIGDGFGQPRHPGGGHAAACGAKRHAEEFAAD